MARTRWSPTWALGFAWAVMVVLTFLALYLGALILDNMSYPERKFAGLGVVLGSIGLGILAVVAAPWVWFLARGGKVALITGCITAGLLLLLALRSGLV